MGKAPDWDLGGGGRVQLRIFWASICSRDYELEVCGVGGWDFGAGGGFEGG
jgi:hypothetical protein